MKPLLLLAILALFLAACVQPAAPVPTPSASPSVLPSATPTPAAATPAASPSATPEPTVEPTPSPAAVANASGVPTLQQFASGAQPVLNAIFNVSRVTQKKDTVFRETEANVWTMGASEGDYTYSVTVSHAKFRWLPEELLEPAVNASGSKNYYSSYSVGGSDKANVMKCYGQRYEINLNLKSYARTWSELDYQPLMRKIMARLVDACPP